MGLPWQWPMMRKTDIAIAAAMLALAASAPASGQGNVAETNSRATIQAAREAEGRKPAKGATNLKRKGTGKREGTSVPRSQWQTKYWWRFAP